MTIQETTQPESYLIGQITAELKMDNPTAFRNIRRAVKAFYEEELRRNPDSFCAQYTLDTIERLK